MKPQRAYRLLLWTFPPRQRQVAGEEVLAILDQGGGLQQWSWREALALGAEGMRARARSSAGGSLRTLWADAAALGALLLLAASVTTVLGESLRGAGAAPLSGAPSWWLGVGAALATVAMWAIVNARLGVALSAAGGACMATLAWAVDAAGDGLLGPFVVVPPVIAASVLTVLAASHVDVRRRRRSLWWLAVPLLMVAEGLLLQVGVLWQLLPLAALLVSQWDPRWAAAVGVSKLADVAQGVIFVAATQSASIAPLVATLCVVVALFISAHVGARRVIHI